MEKIDVNSVIQVLTCNLSRHQENNLYSQRQTATLEFNFEPIHLCQVEVWEEL